MDQDTKQVFWILLWFGFRVGELDNIENIDYEAGSLTVSTLKRNNHTRTLYFDEYTERVLKSSVNKNLFETPYSTLYKQFRRAGNQISVDLTPHICRHTFGTKMGERTDPFTLAKMLGHSIEGASKKMGASKTTGKYVHPSESRIRKVMLENHYLEPLEVKRV